MLFISVKFRCKLVAYFNHCRGCFREVTNIVDTSNANVKWKRWPSNLQLYPSQYIDAHISGRFVCLFVFCCFSWGDRGWYFLILNWFTHLLFLWVFVVVVVVVFICFFNPFLLFALIISIFCSVLDALSIIIQVYLPDIHTWWNPIF
jgi:hypothetical protein